MLMAWRNFWDAFLNNEAYFIARVRSAVGAVALGGVAFGNDLAEAMGTPSVAKYIKIAAILAGGVSLLMRAGDKTPENVKELANAQEDHDPRVHQ